MLLYAMKVSAQDSRMENLFIKNNFEYVYDQEGYRYIVKVKIKNKRYQRLSISAFHIIGSVDSLTVSTMVKSTKLSTDNLEKWVKNANSKVKKGVYFKNKDVVFFELVIPVKYSDNELLKAIKTVAESGDNMEKELSEGDNY